MNCTKKQTFLGKKSFVAALDLAFPISFWSLASDALEEFVEETGVGEVQLVGYLTHAHGAVFQQHFSFGDEGSVYPFLGSDIAGLL